MGTLIKFGLLIFFCLLHPGGAFAEDTAAAPAAVDTGNTAWMLAATALVMLMTLPGLALFYGGLVRAKNALSTIMHSFTTLGIVSVVWVLWCYTLSFGPDHGGFIGGLDYLGLSGVGLIPKEGQSIPHVIFMMFQGMFAVITPALISGSYAERFRFSTFAVFTTLWVTLVYSPVAHWVWGGGWIGQMGAIDFAGGTVVHINSGIAGLAAALVLGHRKGFGREKMAPHNVPSTVLGAGLLWFGWFGFNAGSELAADGIASNAFVVTNTATATAALTWMVAEAYVHEKPTAVGAASGAVAGLVAITPASGYVTPLGSILIGIGAGLFCYYAVVSLKTRFQYDDSLDAFGIHCIGGIWGALATGIFASKAINTTAGLLEGNPGQMGIQAVAVLSTLVYSFVVTYLILKVLGLFMDLRVGDENETIGLDQTQHSETAYNFF